MQLTVHDPENSPLPLPPTAEEIVEEAHSEAARLRFEAGHEEEIDTVGIGHAIALESYAESLGFLALMAGEHPAPKLAGSKNSCESWRVYRDLGRCGRLGVAWTGGDKSEADFRGAFRGDLARIIIYPKEPGAKLGRYRRWLEAAHVKALEWTEYGLRESEDGIDMSGAGRITFTPPESDSPTHQYYVDLSETPTTQTVRRFMPQSPLELRIAKYRDLAGMEIPETYEELVRSEFWNFAGQVLIRVLDQPEFKTDLGAAKHKDMDGDIDPNLLPRKRGAVPEHDRGFDFNSEGYHVDSPFWITLQQVKDLTALGSPKIDDRAREMAMRIMRPDIARLARMTIWQDTYTSLADDRRVVSNRLEWLRQSSSAIQRAMYEAMDTEFSSLLAVINNRVNDLESLAIKVYSLAKQISEETEPVHPKKWRVGISLEDQKKSDA